MSVSSWLTVRLHAPPGGGPVAILRALIAAGWRLDDGGVLTYLPAGGEESDWSSASPGAADEVWRHIDLRAKAGEAVGVVLTWQLSRVGGAFLFRADGTVDFSASVNRRDLAPRLTDVSWYLERLREPLEAIGGILSWEWEQLG